jgi:uncharacterized phage infection (PIP) family protein YhgE
MELTLMKAGSISFRMNKFKIRAFLVIVVVLLQNSNVSGAISLAPLVGAVNRTQMTMVREWAKQIRHMQEQIKQLKDLERIGQKTVDYLADEINNQVNQIEQTNDLLRRMGLPGKVILEKIPWNTKEAERVMELAEKIGIADFSSFRWLGRRISSIYEVIPKKTIHGVDVDYTPEIHARYTNLDKEVALLQEVERKHREIREGLYADLEGCIVQLKTAATDAEVQKIHARINALNGQIALLEAYRNEANQKLMAQYIQNSNQGEKELATNVERSLQENKEESNRFTRLAQTIRLRGN